MKEFWYLTSKSIKKISFKNLIVIYLPFIPKTIRFNLLKAFFHTQFWKIWIKNINQINPNRGLDGEGRIRLFQTFKDLNPTTSLLLFVNNFNRHPFKIKIFP
jgi:hypothetical protein